MAHVLCGGLGRGVRARPRALASGLAGSGIARDVRCRTRSVVGAGTSRGAGLGHVPGANCEWSALLIARGSRRYGFILRADGARCQRGADSVVCAVCRLRLVLRSSAQLMLGTEAC